MLDHKFDRMMFKNFILLLFVHCQINMLRCNGNDTPDTESYLIEHSVKGIKVGEEVHWTLDLKGSYIIGSVRIHATITHHQLFRMLVNDTRASHVCNQTFIEENEWVVINCSDSVVIGRQLTITTSFNNDDQINNTVVIDICTKTSYSMIESEFKIDSELYNASDKAEVLRDGNIDTCLTVKKWYTYKPWVLITLKEEMFIEAFAVMGTNFVPMEDFNVQITNQNTIEILFNESLCNLSQYSIFSCNKKGSHLLMIKKNSEELKNPICETFIFGSMIDSKKKARRDCNFKTLKKFHGTWTIPSTIVCLLLLLISFATWGICRLKPRFWQLVTDSYLKQDLQTNKLQHLIYWKILNGEFEKEFSKLPKEDIKPSFYGLYLHHRAKNRFRNIVPFDGNLVKLEDDESNYINASFIRGFNNDPKAYIATQGPKINTLNDFWNLVWQYKVEVIVMLTQLIETCSSKCVQYWPDCNQREAIFGRISVTIVKESQFPDYVCRYMVINMINQYRETKRAVVHMQFMSWSDYLTPNYCFPLLDFREKVDCLKKYSKSPLLVHCSAGVGRTGTYIAIDSLIKQAELEGKVSVYKCVKDLRLQRMFMVQNKKQYVFLYKTIAEASMILKTRMHCDDFVRKFNGFMTRQSTQSSNTESLIKEECEKSFKVLKKVTQVSHGKTSEGFRTLNFSKNRNRAVVAFDDHRLHVKGGSNCSGYINAVSIQCHKTSSAHVLTQIPLPETRSQFWHMLWEHDLKQVLLLEDDKEYTTFWPECNVIAFDKLTISLTMEEKPNDYYVVRKFLLVNSATNDQEENAKEVTQYHVTKRLWPEHSQVPANKHEFQKILKQLVKSNKRIVLQCLNGSTRCGLTAAALLMIDMILLDEVVDPFLACRYALASRPEAISQEQFSFLYELALACIEDFGNYAFLRSSDYELEIVQH